MSDLRKRSCFTLHLGEIVHDTGGWRSKAGSGFDWTGGIDLWVQAGTYRSGFMENGNSGFRFMARFGFF
ncbi:MAG: hypothetical protein K9M96_10305 [Deltaproteobacteria bacterium]|nr:hypothetical protein [Deltaproteobacteria bacterium]